MNIAKSEHRLWAMRLILVAVILGVTAASNPFRAFAKEDSSDSVAVAEANELGLKRQPYLQRVTPTSITIIWRTTEPTDTRVSYGFTPGVILRNVVFDEFTAEHEVVLTGLRPSTRYFYEVGTSTRTLIGGNQNYYFDTAPLPGETTPFTAWILGDSGTNGTAQRNVRDAMLAATQDNPPDLFLHMGDLAYNSGTDDQLTSAHFFQYRNILRHTPLWTTLGNHDAVSSDSGRQSGPYYESFVLPTQGEAGGVPSGTEAYYSFDYANVHFVCLDSHDSDRSPNSAMMNWLEVDVAATDQEWLIAFWHHPPYTKGSHDSDNAADSQGRMRDMRETALPILEAAGVDLVLTGHSHVYERSMLIDGVWGYGVRPTFATPSTTTLIENGNILDSGDGRPSGDGAYFKSTALLAHQGAVFVVAGHGGASVRMKSLHPVMFMVEDVHGSCLLTIDGRSLSLRNVRVDGEISDTFTLIKVDIFDVQFDSDGDDDVDEIDYASFRTCVTGTDERADPQCRVWHDEDGDKDVDLRDWAQFEVVFSQGNPR